LFEDWVRRDISTAYVQIFDTVLANWYGKGGHEPLPQARRRCRPSV
jgi:sulfatase maturation enzyme AslB (radical SAM superfamily)